MPTTLYARNTKSQLWFDRVFTHTQQLSIKTDKFTFVLDKVFPEDNEYYQIQLFDEVLSK